MDNPTPQQHVWTLAALMRVLPSWNVFHKINLARSFHMQNRIVPPPLNAPDE